VKSRSELERAALHVVESLRDPDFDVETLTDSEKIAGKMRQVQVAMCSGLSDRTFELKGQLVDGNKVVTTGVSGGLHTGKLDMLGLAFEPTGRPVDGHSVVFLEFDDDLKVIDFKKMWDMRKVLLMMGVDFVIPASGDQPEQRISVSNGRPVRVA
jgi:predicted ester cyclase